MAAIASPPIPAETQNSRGVDSGLMMAVERLWPAVARAFDRQPIADLPRSQLTMQVGMIVAEQADFLQGELSLKDRRLLIEQLVQRLATNNQPRMPCRPRQLARSRSGRARAAANRCTRSARAGAAST